MFHEHMINLDKKFTRVPPGRHSTNTIESKHGVIRIIFMRVTNDDENENKELCAIKAVGIFIDVYGIYIPSAFEMVKKGH